MPSWWYVFYHFMLVDENKDFRFAAAFFDSPFLFPTRSLSLIRSLHILPFLMCRARETRRGKSWYFEIHSLNKFSMSWPEGETAVHTARWLKYIERNECARKREKSKHEKDECEKPEDDEKYHNPATIEIEQMLLFYIINFSFSITSSVQRVGIDRRNSHWTFFRRCSQLFAVWQKVDAFTQ